MTMLHTNGIIRRGRIGKCKFILNSAADAPHEHTTLYIAGRTTHAAYSYSRLVDAIKGVEAMLAAHKQGYTRKTGKFTVTRMAPELVSIELASDQVSQAFDADSWLNSVKTGPLFAPFFPVPDSAHVQRVFKSGGCITMYVVDDCQI